MPYERRDYNGGAAATTISGALTSGDTTITIAAATSWPDGTDGPFYCTLDRGTASEERVKVTSRTGTTLSSVTRGVDGTSAVAHAAGAAIEHTVSGVDLDEANYAVAQTVGKVTTAEDLLVGSAANALKRLGKGSDGQILQVLSGLLAWGAIPSGAISSAAMFAAGVVDAAAIASNAVDSAEIAANAVTTSKIAANAVDETKIASSVAGSGLAGGAGTALSVGVDGTTIEVTGDQLNVKALGIDTAQLAASAVETAKIADANVTAAKIAAEAWTSSAPTVGGTGWSLGNGTASGAYIKLGRTVVYRAKVVWGSTSAFGTGGLTLSIPFAAAGAEFVCPVMYLDSGSANYLGYGFVDDSASVVTCYAMTAGTAGRIAQTDNAVPFTWANPDEVRFTLTYEAAS